MKKVTFDSPLAADDKVVLQVSTEVDEEGNPIWVTVSNESEEEV